MAQWILKTNGNVVPSRSVRPLTTLELATDSMKRKMTIFDGLVEKRWGTSVNAYETDAKNFRPDFEELLPQIVRK